MSYDQFSADLVAEVMELRRLLADRPPDCRTCSHYDDTGPGADICYADICTNGDRYDPMPVVQLWKKT